MSETQSVWATPEYESKLLEEVLSRVTRELELKFLLETDEKAYWARVTEEMRECHDDPVYLIENYLWTDKNPGFFSDRIQTLVPFLLFEFQVDTIDQFLDCVMKGEKVFLEKSRQMGISWIVCAFALWGWLFRDWKILFLSQKEDFVDKIGDMQSLFQKIRFMLQELPMWMLPVPNEDRDNPNYTIRNWLTTYTPRLRIFKPIGFGTGSITGDSTSSNAGTGGTYKFVFLDEMAKMENAASINTAIQATTGCIIYNSTPLGKFNEYYKMRMLAIKGKIRHVRLHWSKHPMYSKQWYEWRTRSMLPEQIAQELEINYDASVE